MIARLDEHFFRHAFGHAVATLTRRLGPSHLPAIEDAVQHALMAALTAWPRAGVPEQPSAWIYRAASNRLVDELRQRGRRRRLLDERADVASLTIAAAPSARLAGELPDDLLAMLLACCDDALPPTSQLVLALRLLCGFDVREIALRLFRSEADVYKRLERARQRLRTSPTAFTDLTPTQQVARRPAVHTILYLLFAEGHLAAHADPAVRRELCDEALRLTSLLAAHPLGDDAETAALLALMHLHAARLDGRVDPSGGLLLLAEQDRARWDQAHVAAGLRWLAASARGEAYTRYHAEAAIAAAHCLAPSLPDTRWDEIVACYQRLEQLAPSPLHTLNRAVALAEWRGPAAGLAVLAGLEPPSWLAGSYQWSAVLADLHRRCGHADEARRHREIALATAPSPAVRALLERRLVDGTPG
ncbi:MAG: sigma-70 family RNA polymerase sigma factor [Kofleriaceae bacterium]